MKSRPFYAIIRKYINSIYSTNVPWVALAVSDIALVVELVVSILAVGVKFALVLNWEAVTESDVTLSAVDAVIVVDDDAVQLV